MGFLNSDWGSAGNCEFYVCVLTDSRNGGDTTNFITSTLKQTQFRSFVVRAASVVAPKYASIKPLGDLVLVKIKEAEEKTIWEVSYSHLLLNQNLKETGAQIIYSKYAGTDVEFNGEKHLILKEDDIVGLLETEDIKDLKPLNDRVFIKVAEAEEKTAGGLLLTETSLLLER
ncbi:hypothetical protein F2Q69_00000877 [Brassica cretica]|uniref:Uncharacterized protein n=1 Tax=Brassica cretica TaxID=69181 RepID=A0A8S9PBJ3_BRACR|nr:hypothetical protein F2Q69_00000877 [Brassica cretica]